MTHLLVIIGETASGKTELAIRLAKEFNGEIICADSATVRRGTDVGSAKPSKEEQAQVRHHLLDIVEPDEPFTAAQFKELANQAIKDISARDKLPIMVGGTGLYIDGVIYDYNFRPVSNQAERDELNKLSQAELLEKLSGLGISIEGVDTANKRRLIRLIETKGEQPTRNDLRANTLILGLQPDRDSLKQRVADRVDAQIKAGLEDEVRTLAEQYGWGSEALKGIAFAQWKDYFLGSENRDETRRKIIRANLDLAKRQRTWFKRNKSIQWISTPVKWIDVVDSVTTFLKT